MELRVLTVVVMAIATMTLLNVQDVEGRPSRDVQAAVEDNWSKYYTYTLPECDNSSEIRELCQRCAKVTKSKYAYPLCCQGTEDTRKFCRNFLNFGLTMNDV